MLGEHRPALADLLWERAQLIIKSLEMADVSKKTNEGMQEGSTQIDTSLIQNEANKNQDNKDTIQ